MDEIEEALRECLRELSYAGRENSKAFLKASLALSRRQGLLTRMEDEEAYDARVR